MRIISGKKRGLKLITKEESFVRPTLDRVKENIFNIIQDRISGAVFVDLFGGFGGIAIEAISRGAKKAYICEIDKEAFNIIRKNIEKSDFLNDIIPYNLSYEKGIEKIEAREEFVDIIFLDPPYTYTEEEYLKLLKQIEDKSFFKQETLVIVETEIDFSIENTLFYQVDKRKYGRASLMFLQKKGK